MNVISKYEKFFEKKLLKKKLLKRLIPLITIIVVMIVVITIIAVKRKTITIITSGKKIELVTYKNNVKQALKENNIILDSKDKTIPTPDSPLKNNTLIILKKAVGINIAVDGKNLKIKSAENNIGDLLISEKIVLSSEDKIVPNKKTILSEGLKIKITRVTTKIYKKRIVLNYKVLTKVDPSLSNTKKKIVSVGRNGEKELTYKVIYHNGKVFTQRLIKEIVLKRTIDKLTVLGGYPSMPIATDGKILAYSRKFIARATAYWAVRGVGRTFTGSGRRAIRNPRGYSTIAVDKRLIPYGTKLFVEGYGFAIAADTGSAIIGNTIDVYFNTRGEACNWAVRHPIVYILK